jgi:hypothetical protein
MISSDDWKSLTSTFKLLDAVASVGKKVNDEKTGNWRKGKFTKVVWMD